MHLSFTTGAWRFINKIDVGYKKGPVPYNFIYMGQDPFCTLHLFYSYIKLYGMGSFLYPTSILLIKHQAPVVSRPVYRQSLKMQC